MNVYPPPTTTTFFFFCVPKAGLDGAEFDALTANELLQRLLEGIAGLKQRFGFKLMSLV